MVSFSAIRRVLLLRGTFKPMRMLVSLAANLGWPLFQLDVNNAFIPGDLEKEVYMEQLPRFVAQEKKGVR